MSIKDQLSICEEHTRQILGERSANRLSAWRQYSSESELISFIQRVIRNRSNMANGWELERQGKVSLESIVISNSNLFIDEDVNIAKATLGKN